MAGLGAADSSNAQVGWNRIVMVFNGAHGKFPNDAPFDIERHRLSSYHLAVPAAEEPTGTKKERAARLVELKKPLFELLYEALKAILSHKPSKPTEADEVSTEIRKRRRDIETLRAVLAMIHIPTVDKFL